MKICVIAFASVGLCASGSDALPRVMQVNGMVSPGAASVLRSVRVFVLGGGCVCVSAWVFGSVG